MTETQKLIRFCYVVGVGQTLIHILYYVMGIQQQYVVVDKADKMLYYSIYFYITFGPLLLMHAVASILKYLEDE